MNIHLFKLCCEYAKNDIKIKELKEKLTNKGKMNILKKHPASYPFVTLFVDDETIILITYDKQVSGTIKTLTKIFRARDYDICIDYSLEDVIIEYGKTLKSLGFA